MVTLTFKPHYLLLALARRSRRTRQCPARHRLAPRPKIGHLLSSPPILPLARGPRGKGQRPTANQARPSRDRFQIRAISTVSPA